MLQVIDIHTYYGDSYILQGVSLEVAKKSVAVLMGRNGMGKTTTVRSIIGFTPPRRGTIRFKGVDITGLKPHKIVQMGIGLVPQGRRIFSSLSVKENLMIGANPRSDDHGWDLDRIFSVFPPLKERINYAGSSLSGGELQMLAIARALMSNPDLILMDEPSEGLAPMLVRDVGRVIQQLKEEGDFSILLVEQNLSLAFDVADYIYIISKGKVVYESRPEELKNNDEIKSRHLGV